MASDPSEVAYTTPSDPAESPETKPASPELALRSLSIHGAKWLRIYWVDYASSSKCRLVPTIEIYRALQDGKQVTLSITKASLGILQTDAMIPGVTATGVYDLHPVWSSLRSGPAPGHVSCYGEFRQVNGLDCVLCPRTLLRRTVEKASARGLSFLVGFEIEFVAMQKNADGPEKYRPIPHDGHSWSTSRVLADWGREGSLTTVLDEIVDQLNMAGIAIQQLHAESAPGQYEIVLPPFEPLKACDTLLHARQMIESTAARHGFRITLHPKPWAHACGSASHAHISVSEGGGNAATPSRVYESFYAGVLKHLRAISAFTYPSPASYERAVDGYWAGGRWVAWGSQNRETPLRKIDGSHWEFKALDGMANPYLAVAAILAAGTKGVIDEAPLTFRDCEADPANLTESQRKELGITEMLPQSLEEALEVLKADEDLVEMLHPDAVERYINTKAAETAFLAPMSSEERRAWILERY
ncbi:glutamine synthetase/guanido kinase [Hypoxylon sp. FL0543]|nr:glutamine synthetase/guanido kinase [Hypoxylon sp. FL0543]